MTSIVKPSEEFFDTFERFEIAHRTGALVGDEFANIQILLGSIYANLVKRGLRTEEQAEEFLSNIPNGKYNNFNYPHKGQQSASKTIAQDVNAALFDRENFVRKSQPVKRK